MIRRSSWRHYHHNQMELAANVARWMAAELKWTDAEMETELQRYRRLIGGVEAAAPRIGVATVNNNGHAAASTVRSGAI